jgi:hypothetical protein
MTPVCALASILACLAGVAGCGRLGFADLPAALDGGGPGAIRVTVKTEYPDATSGMAVPGATVLIDRGTGSLERLTTDASGSAEFSAASVRSYHVLRNTGTFWRLYTIAIPGATSVEIGGRDLGQNTMGFSVPPGAVDDHYVLRTVQQCNSVTIGASPQALTLRYPQICEGKTVRLLDYAGQNATVRYIDAGEIALARDTSYSLAGTYQPLPVHTVQIANLPTGTTSAGIELFERAGDDLLSTSFTTPITPPEAGAATLTTAATPGSNVVRVNATGVTSYPMYSGSSQIAPIALGGTTRFDASGMLPLFDTLAVDQPSRLSLAWSGGGGTGTLIAIELTALDSFTWKAYLDPSATALALPALPADLGVPSSATTFEASVTKYDVPGTTAIDIVRSISGGGLSPYDPVRIPTDGLAMTQIGYALGVR